MKRADRNRLSLLGSILAKHTAIERRTLSDLARIGFRFETIDRAYRHLKASQDLARYAADVMFQGALPEIPAPELSPSELLKVIEMQIHAPESSSSLEGNK